MARRLGVIVTAHCENAEIVAQLQARLLAEGKTGPEWHEPSRPTSVEAEGVHHLATFAELTGAHVYVVHTSCMEALAAARRARERGVRLWVETVVPYLVLDKTDAERPDFEGAKYVMSPPLRAKRNPIGVAVYQLQSKLPAELKGKLPTAKQLADVVRSVLPERSAP